MQTSIQLILQHTTYFCYGPSLKTCLSCFRDDANAVIRLLKFNLLANSNSKRQSFCRARSMVIILAKTLNESPPLLTGSVQNIRKAMQTFGKRFLIFLVNICFHPPLPAFLTTPCSYEPVCLGNHICKIKKKYLGWFSQGQIGPKLSFNCRAANTYNVFLQDLDFCLILELPS